MIRNRLTIFAFCFAAIVSTGKGQDLGEYSKDEIKELSQKVEDQVRFLEYFLNTVGSEETSARDKDVIIRESYKKIFRDGQVQIEDDLLLDRKVITNKDVTAYLKDVEFFFKDAEFEFRIREIKPSLKDNDQLFFIVSLDRTLLAKGLDDEKIENTQPRFIEINLERDSNELKIASIYTTKLSRDKELQEWWETLSYEWSTYFREKFGFTEDSLTMDEIHQISSIDSLDLAGNTIIQDLTPLHALRDLKYVDISSTLVQELGPISNITFLSYLDISNTPTEDIQFIKYSDRLTYLDISDTPVSDIEDLRNLSNLKHLKINRTHLQGFGALSAFTALETLELEENGFSNLENISSLKNLKSINLTGNYLINFEFLSGLEQLEEIDLEETNMMDLSPLSGLENLRVININFTEVSDLSPLEGMEDLQRVYADRTSVSEEAADRFTRERRSVLLIHHVETLKEWWKTLPSGWDKVFDDVNPTLGQNPTIEELYTLVGGDSLDLSGSEVISLRPLIKFKKLNHLSFDDTKVHDVSPLSDLKTLETISGNGSAITNLDALAPLNALVYLSFRGTSLATTAPLKGLDNLTFLDIDNTKVPEWEIQELLQAQPEMTVVFRTDELMAWWDGLDDVWQRVFVGQSNISDTPSTRELHSLTANFSLKVEGVSISNLTPLTVFFNLQDLDVHNVPVADLSPLSQMVSLKRLKISQSPITNLEPLSSLENLEFLNVANTGIDDLRPLSSLRFLRGLNASGTNTGRLNGLEDLYELKELDISSTNVRSLNPIMNLIGLEKLICYNTRINDRRVERFKDANPSCEVIYY